jgi:hypothetical protein
MCLRHNDQSVNVFGQFTVAECENYVKHSNQLCLQKGKRLKQFVLTMATVSVGKYSQSSKNLT